MKTSIRTQLYFTQKLVTLLPAVWYGFFVVMLVGSWPQSVLAQESCTLSQITNVTTPHYANGGGPAMNGDGTRIAFSFAGDLTGGNPDGGFDIFLYDTTTAAFTQLTNGSATIGYALPTMSADGKLIAFTQCCNVIVLYDTIAGSSTQLTFSGDSLDPALSADGRHLAFSSTGDLTPNNSGNPDGNFEIFLYDIATGSLTQITNTDTSALGPRKGNFNPAINADGTRIAYGFTTDAGGSSALYLYDTTTGTSTQITTGVYPDIGSNPAINANGTRITYAAVNGYVGLYDTTTGTSTLIPLAGNSSCCQNQDSAINADGTRIAVNAFYYGFNLYDTTTGTLSAFTTIPSNNDTYTSRPAISTDGTRVAVLSRIIAGSTDENLFLLTCGTPPPVVTVAATDATAAEVSSNGSPDPGTFTLSRSGDTTNALTVNFNLTGTATPGTDYNNVGASITVPAGQASATVTVTPIPDTLAEGPETVGLTLASGTGYTVGSPDTATVTIANYTGGLLRGQSSLNFGNVHVGSSADKTLNVINGSLSAPLVVTVNNPSPTPLFSLVSGGGTVVIGPGLSQQVSLRFSPTSVGNATGTLLLNSTDPAKPTATISLGGKGK